MDSLLNLDEFTPSTTSPSTQVPQLAHQSSHFGSSTQTFAGPSFPYDAYRQQTGLPAGGLANTFAINQTAGLQYWNGQGSFVMPSNPIDLPALSKIEDFDFSRMDDLDFDAESPTILSGNPGQFVSPTTLVSSGSSQNQRIYPGMHSQAAQAKAEQAKQQQEMVRRQQQQQQQAPRALPAGQKPLPKAPAGKDPRVEESISRILNQMRQKSVSSDAKTEDSPDPNMSSLPKSRKDEEDMDEDERLLASEEGKKLTSKERRQLRNKVSARAFRSRRKEYIGQLEGEVASKVDEASALRTENQQLREENNRLTELTRMLLSSQAFSGFLQELSQSGGSAPQVQQPTQQRPTTTPVERTHSQTQRKDVNPHDAARKMSTSQQQPMIGMALMPEVNFDSSLFDTSSWTPAVQHNDFQVFAVTELPEPPVIDFNECSEKRVQCDFSSETSKSSPTLSPLPDAVRKAGLSLQTKPHTTASSWLGKTSATVTSIAQDTEFTAINPFTSRTLDGMIMELDETSRRIGLLLPS
ncbi:uncharacterized protein AB675_6279 [Cyphellophora attinorum]|uniref:BZIP domain-containing protein n=1 Tax=Cyphellophora attinorum TaxID=1664694 RepID=A0A0N1HF67_9EURO|nr:uncharacterized protein AB675_6279 [Phialophora attinorum]KPI43866.1 hypothetical protein AB675_6279 [Phialophora attinorum]